MIEYWYKDKDGILRKKTDRDIMLGGAFYVAIAMFASLLIVFIFK